MPPRPTNTLLNILYVYWSAVATQLATSMLAILLDSTCSTYLAISTLVIVLDSNSAN